MAKLDLLVKNGEVWTPGGFIDADIAVSDGKIIALGKPPVLPDSGRPRSSMPRARKLFPA